MKYIEDREPVRFLANFLRKQNQGHIAEDIEKFNKSERFIEYETIEFLPVRHTDVLRSGDSCHFEMESSPRGFCLILLNEKDLEPEAKQLASVFSQMYFTVKVEHQKTCLQIDQIFSEVANNEKYKGYNALVTISIGHGGDGHFCGLSPDDQIPITHLIDKFSEEKASNFKDKPKINIFNCCRSS